MIQSERSVNIIVGGYYIGDHRWNNVHRVIDNCYKVYYVEEGGVWIKDRESTYSLERGKVYLVNGHKLTSYGSKGFRIYWVHFMPQSNELSLMLCALPTVSELSEEVSQQIISLGLFDQKYDEDFVNSDDPLFLMKLRYVIYSSVFDSVDVDAALEEEPLSEYYKIEPSVKYMDEFYTRPVSLEAMATLCNLSVSHYHKLFTQIMHITPINYVLGKKMSIALSLINMNKRFKEVAFELGFCNDAHFSRVFRRYYGLTPGQYKKYLTC
ncbi:MAG: AraC family transcriptional regulator [Rikenellaceae bacterium]